MSDFKKGTKLKLLNGSEISIVKKIGEGGQGAVYSVDYNGKQYALKWYLDNYLRGLKSNCTGFFNNLKENVVDGAPSKHFLWMQDVAVTGKKSKGFGYIMDLRPPNFCEFTKFIKAKERFSSTKAVINAAIQVVEAFQALHRTGKSYQDLSPGNFFIDKDTGDVLICDNDNVAPYGENLGVGGTPGYMAPEVILGKVKPNVDTDLFSLAVILFELFFLSHPLEGANSCRHPCLTSQIEKEIYAEHPIFVCSKEDTSNAPVRGTCSNLVRLWPMYPESFHNKFREAFSYEALHSGQRRLSEKEWKDTLYSLIDSSVSCPKCGELNFSEMAQNGVIQCVGCGKKLPEPRKIVVNTSKLSVEKDKTFTEYHLNRGSRDIAIGTVVESRKNPGFFGLKNVSEKIWSVVYPSMPDQEKYYKNGETVSLISGTTIKIDTKIINII